MAAQPPRLILVRHGTTALNQSPETIRGWSDVPLNKEGLIEALRLGRELSNQGIQQIVTSDLSRALVTASAIATRSGAPVTKTMALRPWNVGQYTAKPVKDVQPELARLVTHATETAPGGEAFHDFLARFVTEFQRLAHRVIMGQTIAVVTHTRDIRVALTWIDGGWHALLNVTPTDILGKAEDPIPPGGWMALQMERGQWRPQSLGSTSSSSSPPSSQSSDGTKVGNA